MKSFCLLLAAVAAAIGCGYNPHPPGPDALDGGESQDDARAMQPAQDGRLAVVEVSASTPDTGAADTRVLLADARVAADVVPDVRAVADGVRRDDAGRLICEENVWNRNMVRLCPTKPGGVACSQMDVLPGAVTPCVIVYRDGQGVQRHEWEVSDCSQCDAIVNAGGAL